jgi:hypothetical protein
MLKMPTMSPFVLGFVVSVTVLSLAILNVDVAFSVIPGLWLCGCLNAVILYRLYRVLASRPGRSVAVGLNPARIEQRET